MSDNDEKELDEAHKLIKKGMTDIILGLVLGVIGLFIIGRAFLMR